MTVITRRAVLPALALALCLGGCATASMTLSQSELQGIRIERIDVAYTPDTFIDWENAEAPYVERIKAAKTSSGKPKPWKQVMKEDEEAAKNEYQTIVNSPEGKQYIRGMLTAELKKRIGAAIMPKFQGTRRVVMEITVHGFSVPGPIRRVVIGGTPLLGAVTVLKDATTGQELAKLDRMAAASAGNGVLGVLVDQGFDDLEDRVFANYIDQVSTWLRTKQDS